MSYYIICVPIRMCVCEWDTHTHTRNGSNTLRMLLVYLIIGFSNLSVFMFCLRFFFFLLYFSVRFYSLRFVVIFFSLSLSLSVSLSLSLFSFFFTYTNILVVAVTLSYVTINLLCVHHDTRPSFIVVHCCAVYARYVYDYNLQYIYCIMCVFVCVSCIWLGYTSMPMTCLLSVCYYFYLFSVLFNVQWKEKEARIFCFLYKFIVLLFIS
jgi:hypothetical protein